MMIKCEKCGHENQMGSIFCRGCGEKIDMSKLTPDVVAAGSALDKSKEKTKDNAKTAVTVIVILAVLAAIIAAAALPSSNPPYQAPSEAAMESAESKFKAASNEKGFRQKEVEFTAEEINALVASRVTSISSVSMAGCKVKNISVTLNGDNITIRAYCSAADTLPVVVAVTGKAKFDSKDEDNPVKFEAESAGIGYIPAVSFESMIADGLKFMLADEQLKQLFKNMSEMTVADGKIKFTSKYTPPAPAKKKSRGKKR